MVQRVSETVEATRSLEKICKWPWDFPNDIGQYAHGIYEDNGPFSCISLEKS
jgi:hypothetical protein